MNKKASKPSADEIREYCPDYYYFDKLHREDAKLRMTQHVKERTLEVIKCIEKPISDIISLGLEFNSTRYSFVCDPAIEQKTLQAIDRWSADWGGVQFSHQFKKKFQKLRMPMTKKEFVKIAKNNQDQTSWKITGDHFFQFHIAQAGTYLKNYCNSLIIDDLLRQEIYNFGCISYIIAILTHQIKFNRTKLKPLLRYKTITHSKRIQYQFEKLCPELVIDQFVKAAKKRRKAFDEKNRSHIQSEVFHSNLLLCCKTIYQIKKIKLYKQLKLPLNNINNNFRKMYPSCMLDILDNKLCCIKYKSYKKINKNDKSNKRQCQWNKLQHNFNDNKLKNKLISDRKIKKRKENEQYLIQRNHQIISNNNSNNNELESYKVIKEVKEQDIDIEIEDQFDHNTNYEQLEQQEIITYNIPPIPIDESLYLLYPTEQEQRTVINSLEDENFTLKLKMERLIHQYRMLSNNGNIPNSNIVIPNPNYNFTQIQRPVITQQIQQQYQPQMIQIPSILQRTSQPQIISNDVFVYSDNQNIIQYNNESLNSSTNSLPPEINFDFSPIPLTFEISNTFPDILH